MLFQVSQVQDGSLLLQKCWLVERFKIRATPSIFPVMWWGNGYAMRICCRFVSFCSNRNARIIIGPIVRPRSPYASYFRLKAQIVRLISCANERSFPVLLRPLSLQMRKWNNIFQGKRRLLDACFRREKYKNELQIFDIAFSYRQTR